VTDMYSRANLALVVAIVREPKVWLKGLRHSE